MSNYPITIDQLYKKRNGLMQMTCNNLPFKIHQCFISFLSISLALIFGSCDRSLSEIEEETVSWPEINRFDDLAFQADGLARVEELGTVVNCYLSYLKRVKR